MTALIIYNEDTLQDVIHVLTYIDSFTEELGVKDVEIDTRLVESVVRGCRADFPYLTGINGSSAFKKIANFVCYFIAEKPVKEKFPRDIVGDDLYEIDNHQNAMIAFALASDALEKSKIKRKDGTQDVVKPIELSGHSYKDIIGALAGATPSAHFKLVSVLFEQLVYKSNPACQYPTK